MLKKIPFKDSKQIFARFALSDEANTCVDPNYAPETNLEILYKEQFLNDLVNFFAYSFPPREGICWAIAVHQKMYDEQFPAGEVLKISQSWVQNPDEAIRRKLMLLSENIDSGDPMHWLCNAVAWNGSGSIGPLDGPIVLPPENLYSAALMGSVALLLSDEKNALEDLLNNVFEIGMDVANGAWPFD